MKKGFSVVLLFFMIFPVFSYNIPQKLAGIWEEKDRVYVFDENQSNELPELVVSLKTYYGRYPDRASEPAEYAEKNPRQRNIANHKEAEHIPFEIRQFVANGKTVKNVWELVITYSKHEVSYIPVAVINDRLYFDFYVQIDNHCYAQFGATDGVKIANQIVRENIGCLIFAVLSDEETVSGDDTSIYDVRYWKSDMDFSEESAFFIDEGLEFFVPKHIFSGVQNYSCTSGRSNKIRNAPKPVDLKYSDFIFSDDKVIAVRTNAKFAVRK